MHFFQRIRRIHLNTVSGSEINQSATYQCEGSVARCTLGGGYMKAEAAWSGQSNFEVFETSERSQAAMFLGPSTSLSPMELSVLDWMSKSFFLSQVSTAKLHSAAIRSLHITKRLRWKSVSNALPDSVSVRKGSDMREWMYHRAMA